MHASDRPLLGGCLKSIKVLRAQTLEYLNSTYVLVVDKVARCLTRLFSRGAIRKLNGSFFQKAQTCDAKS